MSTEAHEETAIAHNWVTKHPPSPQRATTPKPPLTTRRVASGLRLRMIKALTSHSQGRCGRRQAEVSGPTLRFPGLTSVVVRQWVHVSAVRFSPARLTASGP